MSSDRGEPMLAAAIAAAAVVTVIVIVGAVWIVGGIAMGVAYASWWGYTTYRNKKQEEQFPPLKFVHKKLKDRNLPPGEKQAWKDAKKSVLSNHPVIVYHKNNPDNELFAYGSPAELAEKRHQIREELEKRQREHIFLKQNSS